MQGRSSVNAYRHLFIAGASRSGTTLLMNLLDGHPELLVFPMEHKVFKHYFIEPASRRRAYFTEPFITERSQGQQTILASHELYERYRDRIRREFGTAFDLDVDHDRFLRRYRQYLDGTEVTLERVFDAMMSGLAAANDHAAENYGRLQVAVFKDPFTTEFQAQRAAALMPSARFLHVVRDPYARYCSVKRRRVQRGSVTRRKVVPRLHAQDFVTGFAEQAISSLHVGLQNRRALGEDTYRILRFEDLIGAPEQVMGDVAGWLGVSFDPVLLQPTRLAAPIASGSSFNPAATLDASAAHRREQYFIDMTSPSERDVYHRYLASSDYGCFYALVEPAPGRQAWTTWLRPFKRERVRDYAWRIATRRAWIGRRADAVAHSLRTRLPREYKAGRLG